MLMALLDRLRHHRRRSTWTADQALGRRGEDLAHRYLRGLGYTIVARNWRLPSGDGEADLIAWDAGELVIVEVKTRESAEFGPPDRAISPEKVRSLARIGRAWSRYSSASRVRVDVVAVVLTDPPELNLYRDAVDIQLAPALPLS